MQSLGKHIEPFVYVHESAYAEMPSAWRSQVDAARRLAAEAGWTGAANVFKINKSVREVSLLHYPEFFTFPFPELRSSIHVDLVASAVSVRDYASQENPPILHRKELLLSPADPKRYELSLVTQQAEAAGLFDSPKSIGTRQQWLATIAAKGYTLTDGTLLPLANELNDGGDDFGEEDGLDGQSIARHRTALRRTGLSAPAQALLRRGLLREGSSFFDYGCGRGDDITALRDIGVDAHGWDPYFAKEKEKQRAEVVNLGFVINVIEDREERDAALKEAFALADQVLSVAAMLSNRAPGNARPFRDGYLTSRRTFQRYFSQIQLRDYIQEVLFEEPIAIAPGIFFVFKNKEMEQQLFRARYSAPLSLRPSARVPAPGIPKPLRVSMPRLPREPRNVQRAAKLAPEVEFHAELSELWSLGVSIGRFPEPQDVGPSLADRLTAAGLSLRRCQALAYRMFDAGEIERTLRRKRDDLLVVLGVQRLLNPKRRRLEGHASQDIRVCFGTAAEALDRASQLVLELRNAELIEQLCADAHEVGLGWMEDGQLQFAASLLPRLHPLLRLYVAAATILQGSLEGFDLLKIHSRSGKVSLLRFDNFADNPVPQLRFRVKVNLRTQEADEYLYGQEFPAPILHLKSRYMDKDAPGYGQQLKFETQLAGLRLFSFDGFGPSASEFLEGLRVHRWEIVEGELARSQQTPSIDDNCGRYLTYRNLVECGETYESAGIANLPKNPETYNALYELAVHVLDPVTEYFGAVRLTYGFCSPGLSRLVPGRIAPKLDQHAGHELRGGKLICERGGAACDFIVDDEDMFDVAQWVYENTPVDRIYIYGRTRPIHVSFSSHRSGLVYQMIASASGRTLPRQISKPGSKLLTFVQTD